MEVKRVEKEKRKQNENEAGKIESPSRMICKMFQQIHPRDLVKGHKYKINGYTGYYQYKIGAVAVFQNVREHVEIEMFPMAGYTFEEFVSEKPQEKMEKRALNMILRSILGDCFEW